MNGKGTKLASAPIIELPKELHILQAVCMYIRAKDIYPNIKRVPYDKYNREYDSSHRAAANHGAHLIKHRRYNSRGQTEGKKP